MMKNGHYDDSDEGNDVNGDHDDSDDRWGWWWQWQMSPYLDFFCHAIWISMSMNFVRNWSKTWKILFATIVHSPCFFLSFFLLVLRAGIVTILWKFEYTHISLHMYRVIYTLFCFSWCNRSLVECLSTLQGAKVQPINCLGLTLFS